MDVPTPSNISEMAAAERTHRMRYTQIGRLIATNEIGGYASLATETYAPGLMGRQIARSIGHDPNVKRNPNVERVGYASVARDALRAANATVTHLGSKYPTIAACGMGGLTRVGFIAQDGGAFPVTCKRCLKRL